MIRRLTYTPEVHAFINITEPKNPNYGKIIDVSQDIIGGTINRNLEAVSTAELRLQNKNGKYLGGYHNGRGEAFSGYLFTPMDKLIITMARFGDPFRVFTGYLDEVPAFQLYPDQVTIRASCPLKRLLYTYLDPGLPFFYHFLQKYHFGYDVSTGTIFAQGDLQLGNLDVKGNIGELIYDILTDPTVGNWDPSTVHIINFPKAFSEAMINATNNYKASDLVSGQADGANSNQATTSSNGNSNSSGNDYSQGFHVEYNDIIQGLISRGMHPLDAVALAGRATQENQRWTSNVPLSHDAQGQVVGGFGLFQWNGSRTTNLINFATKHGGNPVDLKQQLDFLIYENNTTEASAWSTVTHATNLNDKVVAFSTNWEGGTLGAAVSYAYDALASIKTVYPNILDGLTPSDMKAIQDASDNNDNRYAIHSSAILNQITTPGALSSVPPADTIVGLAESQVGTRETANNSGPQIDRYLAAAGSRSGEPWCAAFVYWVFHKVGLKVPKTADVIDMWSSLKSYQQILNDGTNKPQPGDMVFYGSSPGSLYHMGIVSRVDSDSTYTTIEGNTSNNAVQGSGDTWVAKHTHSLSDSSVYGFGRITTDSNKIGVDVANSTNANPGSGGGNSGGGGSLGDGIPIPSNSQLTYGAVPYLRTTPAPNFSLSNALDAAHGLVDAIPLIQLIQDYSAGAMRTYCSGPDGDFYSFFPDYFGWFGTTPYFKIEDIELVSLNVQLTDENLKTHVYGVGPVLGYNAISAFDFAIGPIASVEAKAFQVFIKTDPSITPGPTGSFSPQDMLSTFYTKANFDSEDFLQRYGARPMIQQFATIRMPEMLWLATWYQFLQSWADTYIVENAEFTFMPELFPGGRVNIADRISFFIESVTHEFDFQGGFSTSATLSAATVEDTTMDGEAQRTLQQGTQVGK